ncbi:MAG: type II toxin-antitoxin system VapC family toxin [Candidatus Rokubacteria bacterium]|nr:type II toxin-antitoxin system VapC family toxin [Candidatus Rokubacteria bacterium]
MMVADTDVLIDFLEGIEPAARRVALELEHHGLATTAVSRFELRAGARTDRQRRLVAELLAALPCLPLDDAGADQAAEVRRALTTRGVDIGMGDSLIAGIVLAHRGVLLTRNRRHFERVPDLSLGTL